MFDDYGKRVWLKLIESLCLHTSKCGQMRAALTEDDLRLNAWGRAWNLLREAEEEWEVLKDLIRRSRLRRLAGVGSEKPEVPAS